MKVSEPTRNVAAATRFGARASTGQLEQDFAQYVDNGDRVALGQTIARVTPELRRIARYYVRHHDHTEDLVQATILTAIERAAAFDRTRRLIPWLTGILLNKIAAHRRDARTRFVELADEAPQTPLRDRSPSTRAHAHEVEQLVEEALEQLPPRYREVLDMYLRQGKRGGEIASELDRPAGTIRAQIHRGLRRLRTLLPPSLALGSLFALRRPGHASERGARLPSPAGSLANVAPLIPLSVGLAVFAIVVASIVPWGTSSRESHEVAATLNVSTKDLGVAHVIDTAPTESSRSSLGVAPSLAPVAPTATLTLRAVDRETGKPLAGAEIALRAELRGGVRIDHADTTDRAGRLSIEANPEDLARLHASASAEGYETLLAEWDHENGGFARDTTLLLPLLHTFPIGGLVVDEYGTPIADATVHAVRPLLENGESFRLSDEEIETTSDASGRWRIDALGGRAASLRVRATHPDYAPMLSYDSAPSLEALRDLRERLVLRRGRAVEIVVRDRAGTPIPNVRLTLGEPFDPPRSATTFATDENGLASFSLPPTGRVTIVAAAEGYERRALRRIDPVLSDPSERTRIETHLEPAGTTSVLVVDDRGAPVTNALVRVFRETWGEAHATDGEGRVELPFHSMGSIWTQMRRADFGGTVFRKIDLRAGRVALPPVVRLLVSVTDSSTGAPVANSSISVVASSGRRIATRTDPSSNPVELSFHAPGAPVVVEVTRDGYEISRSAELRLGPDPVDVVAQLQPAQPLDLSLRTSTGKPVGFFEAAIATPDSPVELERWTVHASELHPRKLQRYGGDEVRMNRPSGDFSLVVSCREGIAIVPGSGLGESATIRVNPCCCLEGTALPHESIRIDRGSLGRASGVVLEFQTITDESGRFHFCGLPAGTVEVFAESRPGKSLSASLTPGGLARVAF